MNMPNYESDSIARANIRLKEFIEELVENNKTTIYNKVGKKEQDANVFKYTLTYNEILTSGLGYSLFSDQEEKCPIIIEMLKKEKRYVHREKWDLSMSIYFNFHPKKKELFENEINRAKEVCEIFKKYDDVSKYLAHLLIMKPQKKELDSSYKDVYEYALNKLLDKEQIRHNIKKTSKLTYWRTSYFWTSLEKTINFFNLSKNNIELMKVEIKFIKDYIKIFQEIVAEEKLEYSEKSMFKDIFNELKFAKFYKDIEKSIAKGEYSQEEMHELKEFVDSVFPEIEQKNKKNAEVLIVSEIKEIESNNSIFFLETMYNTGYLALKILEEGSKLEDKNIISLDIIENDEKVSKDFLTLRESKVHKNLIKIEIVYLQEFSWKEKEQLTKIISKILADFIQEEEFDYRWNQEGEKEFQNKAKEVLREILLKREMENISVYKSDIKKNKI